MASSNYIREKKHNGALLNKRRGISPRGEGGITPERFSYYASILQALRKILRATGFNGSPKKKTKNSLTAFQLVCLLIIKKRGPLSIEDLAVEAYLSSETVGILFKKLLSKKLIIALKKSLGPEGEVKISALGEKVTKAIPFLVREAFFESLRKFPLNDTDKADSLERIAELV